MLRLTGLSSVSPCGNNRWDLFWFNFFPIFFGHLSIKNTQPYNSTFELYNRSFSIVSCSTRDTTPCDLCMMTLGLTHQTIEVRQLSYLFCLWLFPWSYSVLDKNVGTYYYILKQIRSGFLLHLLAFLFVYLFNSRIVAPVWASFAND